MLLQALKICNIDLKSEVVLFKIEKERLLNDKFNNK